MESARLRSFVLCNLVLYAGMFLVAIGGVGVGFLVRLCVRAGMGSSSFGMLLSVLGMGLVKAF